MLRPPSAIALLIVALATEAALAGEPRERAFEAAYRSRRVSERREAVRPLLGAVDRTSVRLLSERVLALEEDPSILHEVIVGLRTLPAGEPREPLLEAYDRSTGPHRLRLARALALMPGGPIRDRLLTLATAGDGAQRTVALSGLAGRDGEAVGRALATGLLDPVWEVRAAAIDGLAARRDPGTVGALIDALASAEARLRNDLVAALRTISGAGIGADAAQWRRWHDSHPSGRAPSMVAEGRVPSVCPELGCPTGRTVYVVDLSRSMAEPIEVTPDLRRPLARGGHLAAKGPLRRIDLAMALLRKSLATMKPLEARFDVVLMAGRPRAVRGRLVPAGPREVRRILGRIGNLSPSGPTDVAGALALALALRPEGARRDSAPVGAERVVLISEGFPSGGEVRDRASIVSRVREAHLLRRVRVDTVGIGPCDVELLAGLARVTGGRFTRVGE